MSATVTTFQRGVIRPTECISEGWQLVKREYWLMVGLCFVAILIGSVAPFGILLGPMMCGIHMCIFALGRGERPSFNLAFKGFDFFMPSFVATLVQMVPAIVVIVPVYLIFIVPGISAGAMSSAHGEPPPEFFAIFFGGIAVVMVVAIVASVLIGMFFMFTYQLIVDRGLSGWDACTTSVRAVLANFGGALGLMLVVALLGMAGVLACYVGAILMLPVSLAAFDVAYRRVFPAIESPSSPLTPPAPPQYPNYGDRFSG